VYLGATLLTEGGSSALTPYAWAARPGSATVGARIMITDIGPQWAEFIWDGAYWRPTGVTPLLFQATEIPKTDADTVKQTAFAYTIPAGLMAPGTSLRGPFKISASAVGGGVKYMEFLLGGIGAGSFGLQATNLDLQGEFRLTAIDAGNYECWWPGNGTTYGESPGAAHVAGARNFSTALTLQGNIQWGTAGTGTRTLTFRPFKLFLFP
jgi:hypothetical protein